MATRRSRLSIKPNIGPKVGAAKVGSTKQKAVTDKKGAPKKETLDRLRKKVSEDDVEKELDTDVSNPKENTKGLEQPTSNNVEKMKPDDNTKDQSSEIISTVKKDQLQVNSEKGKDKDDKVMTGSQSQDKTSTESNEKECGNSAPMIAKLPVSPKNKVQMITRNRLPKARPNLSDAGRPKKAPDTAMKGGTNQSGPLSPVKMPRPIISQSPDKALSSPEKSAVVARELKVHYPNTSNTDTSEQASNSETKQSGPSGETTVAERRHRNLSGIDVPPIIERRQRQMSTSEAAVGEKRHRHASVAEAPAPKRKKHTKIDAPTDVPVDRTKIKMGDLIYWNPSSNPMKKKAGQEKKKKKPVSPLSDDEDEESVVSLTGPTQEEEKLDDPEPMEDEAMPVPQVKIGPDGNIIINEESLVIKNNESIIEEDGDVIDETDSMVTYTSFRKQRSKLSWSEKETQKFYKALSHIGTDFSLMLNVFPKRTRNDIKKKFAIEDKKNRDKVEAALRNKKPFNMAVFEEEDEVVVEKTKPPGRSKKRSKKENKTVDKSTRKNRSDWKYYYKENEESEENEAKKSEQKRQQVEEARRRLLANRNSSQKVPRGPEESNEIVEILMNMSKGSNPVPPVNDTPHVENVMVMQSGMPVVDIGTNTEQLVQLLQTSGQAALIGDNVNEPLILVYNRPTVPGGETVIHVYKIQPDSNNPLNVPTTQQQREEQPGTVSGTNLDLNNMPACIDVNLSRTNGPNDFINVTNSDCSIQTHIQNHVDINITTSTGTQENLETQRTVQNIPKETEKALDNVPSGHFYHNLHNYSESVSLTDSIEQNQEHFVTDMELPESCSTHDGTESEENLDSVSNVLSHDSQGKAVVVQSEQQENISGVDTFTELNEQYIDDMTSVIPQTHEYTCNS